MFSAPASPVPPRTAPDALLDADGSPRERPTPPSGHGTFTICDSATDEPLGGVVATDDDGVRDAVARASAAGPRWSRTPVGERAAVLRGWSTALRHQASELALSLTRETGALLGDAHAQVDAGIEAIERYAVLGRLHRDRRALGDAEAIERTPRGVVAVLLPWRDPVALACAQLAACLTTGNTVVVKPSGRAPLSVERAVRLLTAPDGVVGLVHGGAPTGACLASDLDVGMVIHTGSVETGQAVAASCAARLRAAIVEQGGKGAVIVDRGVEPSVAAAYAATAAFSHAGQLCGSVDRLLVHRTVYDRFLDAFLARTERLRLGDGVDRASTLAPLVDPRQRAAVHGQVTATIAEGAHLLTGGTVPPGPGCFYPATVLDHVSPTTAIWSQKTFGPVAALAPFDDVDDALRATSDGGLRGAVTLLTVDPAHADRAVREHAIGAVDPGGLASGPASVAIERLRQPGTGLGYGHELLDELTRWRVARRAI
ncbi:MAG: aldehyde dehydrogenase family protein [Patulibacter sp.]|nr:aldehyde dehydrogenase family protein [Patulibacter sp.]